MRRIIIAGASGMVGGIVLRSTRLDLSFRSDFTRPETIWNRAHEIDGGDTQGLLDSIER